MRITAGILKHCHAEDKHENDQHIEAVAKILPLSENHLQDHIHEGNEDTSHDNPCRHMRVDLVRFLPEQSKIRRIEQFLHPLQQSMKFFSSLKVFHSYSPSYSSVTVATGFHAT